MISHCAHCNQLPLDTFSAKHVCPSCGLPQPLSLSEDYFSVFGLLRRFGVDRSLLEKRFYELSRLLHPDRFSTVASDVKMLSLARMSLVNQAYGVLKYPNSLRDYLLKLEGIHTPKASIPVNLAETWFEIQDLQSENVEAALQAALEFERELNQVKIDVENHLLNLERQYDLEISHEMLDKIAVLTQDLAYLSSMQKDVERMKKNAYSN